MEASWMRPIMTKRLRVLAVGHDGGRQGAPIILRDTLAWMLEHTGHRFEVVLHHDGPLRAEYQCLAPTKVLNPFAGSPRAVARIVRRLASPDRLERFLGRRLRRRIEAARFDVAWINSVASWRAAELLIPVSIPRVLHVHELEYVISKVGPPTGSLATRAMSFIAASKAVRDNLIVRHGIDAERIMVLYSSVPQRAVDPLTNSQRMAGRDRFNLGVNELMLIGCGRAGQRKGVDLLPELMQLVRGERGLETAKMVWIGQISGEVETRIQQDCRERGIAGAVEFVGEVDDPAPLMALGDVFVLPSREEPLGLVCLEAAQSGIPTVCFQDAGGAPEFVGDDAGRVVPFLDVPAMASAVAELGRLPELRAHLAACGRRRVAEVFNIERQAPVLADLLARVAGRS